MGLDSTSPSPRHKTYAKAAALSGDVNLKADFPSGGARMIRVGVAGDLVLVSASGAEDPIYNVQVGEPVIGQWVTIRQVGTTAEKITAYE